MAKLVTLFGGAGFLGRYVAQELLSAGARVRVAERDPKHAFFVKPLGGLGQTQFVAADVTKAESARRAAQGSDAVINLVGVLKGDFRTVHVDGARNAAAAATATGAGAFVQVSAIGADPEAPSAYGRSKGEGEAAAREAFEGATILRPSILFGAEDQFLNRFAGMAQLAPVLPVIRPEAKFQPVWVGDVARAVATAALHPEEYAGKTFELGGPEVLSMEALMGWLMKATGRNRPLLPLPDSVGGLMARFGWLPGAPITQDQWLMLQKDNVVSAGMPGFEAFGITPSPLAALAPAWLVSYRRHGRFGAQTA
ncbi:complex I NDUFA9 subunit family protein [Flavisphingomonas formosensis]|uniref:complex I NDUFA9 subunit family protein n=1 Tax=Flavisphingomonas formosensis TaxID=861534 RepID=UPI0012FBAFF4|nr:complex I NDUFA9 subunit family protein [Sphingomonas formosensis]